MDVLVFLGGMILLERLIAGNAHLVSLKMDLECAKIVGINVMDVMEMLILVSVVLIHKEFLDYVIVLTVHMIMEQIQYAILVYILVIIVQAIQIVFPVLILLKEQLQMIVDVLILIMIMEVFVIYVNIHVRIVSMIVNIALHAIIIYIDIQTIVVLVGMGIMIIISNVNNVMLDAYLAKILGINVQFVSKGKGEIQLLLIVGVMLDIILYKIN